MKSSESAPASSDILGTDAPSLARGPKRAPLRGHAGVLCCGLAVALWLWLGASLGWYYTFTYYGRAGWPMPTPDSCAALVLYYFSVLNVATEVQALHWLLVFPLAGMLWVTTLRVTARFFHTRVGAFVPDMSRFALTTIPLLLPSPWMAYLAGRTAEGFSWDRMVAVALRRGWIVPASWLSSLYFTLGVLALILHIRAYRRAYELRGARAVLHFLTATIVLTLAACTVGGVLGFPLRKILE